MAEQEKAFLDSAYGLEDADDTRDMYAGWAATYEKELTENGYVTPERCAKALAEAVEDKTGPLLDLGCGTGLSGLALRQHGFTTIDGSDFSEPMLDLAREKTSLYRQLTVADLHNPLPASPGQYENIAAIGVFSPGHAPAEMIERVMGVLPAGGCFVFSLNDHALEDPSYESEVRRLEASGSIDIAFRAYGPHITRRAINATIYVLKRRI